MDIKQEQTKTPEEMPEKEESLEELFGQLDGILNSMENPDITLEEAFSFYEQGMKKIRCCNEKLDLVEKKMMVIADDGAEVPFE